MKLEGKVAIITGSTKGIGRSMASRYAREGATVAIVSRNAEQCAAVAAEIVAEGGKAIAASGDISQLDDIHRIVDLVVEKAGKVDILVNNAGVVELEPLENITEQSWDYVWDTNVKGLVFLMQAVAAKMIAQGQGGKIINISSQAGRRGDKFCMSYGAAKAAVIHITQTAAFELAEHGINVNGIAPGVIDTDMWIKVDRQFGEHHGRPIGASKRKAEEAVPLGRFGRPDDIDGAAVFLASADSAYMTAQTLNVDGGNIPS